MDTETGSSTLTGPEREREIAIYPMFEKKYKTTRRKSRQKINKLMKKSLFEKDLSICLALPCCDVI